MSRVLVIDDSDNVRRTLKAMLESAGHHVAVACDGVDGVARFQDQPFDLVISDIVMPRKDGLQTVRELRQMTDEVPIIVMSSGFRLADSGANQRDIDDLRFITEELGATRTVNKPVSCGDLLAVIGECLGEVRAARSDPVVGDGR